MSIINSAAAAAAAADDDDDFGKQFLWPTADNWISSLACVWEE